MIIVQSGPVNVVALQIKDSFTSSDVKEIKVILEKALAGSHEIGIVTDISEMSDVTLDAIKDKAALEMGKIGQFKQFKKIAILSNKSWPVVLFSILNFIIPHIELKTFDPSQFQEALVWATPSMR